MFELFETPIDTAQLKSRLAHPETGALVTFEGWVRDHNEGKPVASLEYEAHPALALKEASAILEEVRNTFEVQQVICVHRVGHLEIGSMAVWVGVTAAHRDAAFAACRYVIDEIKERVPIWKKEHYVEGDAKWIGDPESPSTP